MRSVNAELDKNVDENFVMAVRARYNTYFVKLYSPSSFIAVDIHCATIE